MAQTSRILFIGNSYTGRNGLPAMIAKLAASGAHPIEVETEAVIANGMSLKYHWDHGHALAAVARSRWDFVVLQEQSTLPLKNRAKMHEYVEKFDGEIKRCGAATVLYQTWARRNAPERQADLSDAYNSVGSRLGAVVVPVGAVWQRVLHDHPEIDLYEADNSHPTLAGSYLAACVFTVALWGGGQLGDWLPAAPPRAADPLPAPVAARLRDAARAGPSWDQGDAGPAC